MSEDRVELPRYKCHKQVWALKIKDIQIVYRGAEAFGARITPEEEGYAPFEVPAFYMDKHSPRIGGYYVVYDDGYTSFSPAVAFEQGYTRIE